MLPNTVRIQTCLSENVRKMLCEVGVTDVTLSDSAFLSDKLTLDSDKLRSLLESCGDRDASPDWHEVSLSKLSPVIHSVCRVFRSLPAETFWISSALLAWTGEEKAFEECLCRLQSPDECSAVLCVLKVTAILERCLGDVLFSRHVPVPFLLKDILTQPELSAVFGTELMLVLQIVMGSPRSLNLRNVVWHGFVTPREVDRRLPFFLICAAMSLGKRLAESGSQHEAIVRRRRFSFVDTELALNDFLGVGFDEQSFLSVLEASPLVLPGRMPFWHSCVQLYNESRYDESLVLALPQVECILRVLFTVANDCPWRLLTAEMSTLYTTLDEVLAEFTDDRTCNALRKILGDSHFEIYLDLFAYLEGPRLRVRISHGEADLSSIRKPLLIHLFNTVAATCANSLCENHKLQKCSTLGSLRSVAVSYHSHFHPIQLLRKKVLNTIEALKSWEEFIVQEKLGDSSVHCDPLGEPAKHCILLLMSKFDIRLPVQLRTEATPGTLVADLSPRTVFRPRRELEVTTMLRQVCQEAHRSLRQVHETLAERTERWRLHQLRSRQRDNYKRLLESLPVLRKGATLALWIVCCCLRRINDMTTLDALQYEKLVRLLKTTLKFSENFGTLTSSSNNRWDECCQLCCNHVDNALRTLSDGQMSLFSGLVTKTALSIETGV